MHILRSIRYRVFQIRKSHDHQRIAELKFMDEFPRGYHEGENMALADYLFLPAEHAENWVGSLI